MPKVLKALGWIGMIAMLMVGGGIIIHNIDILHFLSHLGQELPLFLPIVMEFGIIPILVSIIIGTLVVLTLKLINKKSSSQKLTQ